ncbi:MAG: hypothetical protein Q7S31_00535 [bacterium]|nr:hypothetical protein [bacterium]
MINLLPTAVAADSGLVKIKKWVQIGTTLVLVGYLLVLAALAGGNWYLANREQTISGEMTQLTGQVSQLAEMEAILRQQQDRIKLVNQSLAARVKLADVADKLTGANVVGWESLPTGKQVVTAQSSDSASLEIYADSLKNNFGTVTVNKLARDKSGQWQIEVALVGGRK